MKVLLVGSGGREHVLAWKLNQSSRLEKLWIAPGNAGTASLGENLPISAENAAALVNFAYSNAADLVIVGPEAPLAAGLVDLLAEVGLRAFGPSRAAAQIEASKSFAKDFMARHGIPTARYAIFSDYPDAMRYLHNLSYPVVIKASGLAAGKGVIVPHSIEDAQAALRSILLDKEFGEAGAEVVIEERLEGEEVSLLAFTDGYTVRTMPPAQDHKRLLDGDQGPNTGGMGAFAPAPLCSPEMVERFIQSVLQPAVDGLREEGMPFVGVLYAGLMLTREGPRVLEFNSRFGDPETQAILPLLETDLLEVIEACVDGRLQTVDLVWKPATAACIVVASQGYPGRASTGKPIKGLELAQANALVFHAGTHQEGDRTLTSGGRVLGVTGLGEDLAHALEVVFQAVSKIHFDGMQYRKDIGKRQAAIPIDSLSAYAASGVSIDSGNRAVDLMRSAVQSTYGTQVLAGIGAFGGLFDAAEVKSMQHPVLVASTDSVGTKVKLAAKAESYVSIGQDLVNHCINDILVQGARPLFFLDYFAASHLRPEVVAEVVSGIASACRESGCALIGGETAELPGVYAEGEFDLAGTIVGIVEHTHILPHLDIKPGDVLVGLRSSGPHTNGYSLIRKVFEDAALDSVFPELSQPLGEVLLAPHRSYLALLQTILKREPTLIKALVHLTGGGFLENIPRILPEGVGAQVHLGSWPVPPLFKLIQSRGAVSETEMYRVFNMGIGMLAVVAADRASALQSAIPEESWLVGELVAGSKEVSLV
jgi:phosphoribosylamine--glycine ligase/phosphoribosylformylglycinamidine cyclo-ligase